LQTQRSNKRKSISRIEAGAGISAEEVEALEARKVKWHENFSG